MSMIQRFLRDGTPAGVLRVVDGEWNAGTDGTDSITLTVIGELNKGDFIMWEDDDGDLHEHEISESSSSHTSGVALVNATGINSVSELYGFQLPGLAGLEQPVRMQVSNFMETYLGGDPSPTDNDSHWVWGDNGTYGFSIASEYFVVSFEEKESLRSALAKIATYLGAEMRAVLTKENGEYVRTIYMYRPMSTEAIYVDPVKRFTFGKNVDGIKRDIAGDTLYSAVHAYGAAIKDADGNETGARYECYAWGTDAQKNAYGYRGADGNMHHSVAIYENSDIDNLTDLQTDADRYLAYVSQPQVTYTCDIANVEGVKLGDYVDIIDEGFTPELRKRARVTSIKQKILAPTRSGTVVIGKKKDEFTSAIVKANEASKSDPNSDAHEEASTVSKLDSQVNDTDAGLEKRVTTLENRNATSDQTGFVKPDGTTTTVDADGTMHAGGGDNPYINEYESGVGVFDPNHISETDAVLYAEPTMEGQSVKYLKLRATLNSVIAKLRKPFVEFQRYTSSDAGGAFMKIQPPATDDSVESFAYISMTDPHKNTSNNKGDIYLRVKYFDSSGNSDFATIRINGREITLDDGKTWGTVKIKKDLIQIGSDNAQSAHIWLVRETGTKGNAGDINIYGARVIVNGNEIQ